MLRGQNWLKIAVFLFALTTVSAPSSSLAERLSSGNVRRSGASSLPTLISITRGNLGGEARYVGKLRIEHRCIVAVLGKRLATVLFDPETTLGKDLQSLNERSRSPIRFGQSFAAATAVLRDNGRGWPIADIESFYGVIIPARCPHRDVIRLRHLAPINVDEH